MEINFEYYLYKTNKYVWQDIILMAIEYNTSVERIIGRLINTGLLSRISESQIDMLVEYINNELRNSRTHNKFKLEVESEQVPLF